MMKISWWGHFFLVFGWSFYDIVALRTLASASYVTTNQLHFVLPWSVFNMILSLQYQLSIVGYAYKLHDI